MGSVPSAGGEAEGRGEVGKPRRDLAAAWCGSKKRSRPREVFTEEGNEHVFGQRRIEAIGQDVIWRIDALNAYCHALL